MSSPVRSLSHTLSTDTKPLESESSTSARPMIVAPRGMATRRTGAPETERAQALARPGAGFILADAQGHPIYANLEAKKIVAYPRSPGSFQSGWASFRKTMFAFSNKQKSSLSATHSECMSGRRKYACRAIALDHSGAGQSRLGSVAIVLERCGAASHSIGRMSEHFRLTAREREVVELLIQGLTNKEIAARMQISPNTVRAFLRMVMGKLGISTRSGIVGAVFHGLHADSWNMWNGF